MKKLGFGGMRLPISDKNDNSSFDYTELFQMVDTFLENGFCYFDTAYMYHSFKSECAFKKALCERHPRESFILADKMPTMHLKAREDLERIFSEQLEKTGAGYFDYYLMHCLDTEFYERAERLRAFEFCAQKKREGKIKRLGFSFHDTADVLDKILTEHPEVEFVQLQINYLDWEDPSIQSRLCYETARRHGKEIIIMEPVKGGKLAELPCSAAALLKESAPDLSIASWAIRFAASLPGVIMVLSGMSNLSQLNDNISYMKELVPLTDKEKALCFEAAEIILREDNIPCTACCYCVTECPVSIPIPEYFAAYNNHKTAAYSHLSKKQSISNCIECHACEGHCPQHIAIPQMLKRVQEKFE